MIFGRRPARIFSAKKTEKLQRLGAAKRVDTLGKEGQKCKRKCGGFHDVREPPSPVHSPRVSTLFRSYREVVFVGVFLALPVLVYVSRDQKRWFDRGLMAFTAPVEQGITVAVGSVTDAWGKYIWLRKVRDQDFEIRRDLQHSKAGLQLAAEISQENIRLRGLLELADKSRPMKLVAAPVIAVGASPHSHTLRIARGAKEGIKTGQAVIAPEGIVGTVLLATDGYADVQLIVAPQAAVPAISARTRSRSTVRGTGDLARCHLDYALRKDELADGDLLITAGGSGFFPKGLNIGHVVDVQKRATGMFIGAEVIPSVDFSRLDEVLVVTDSPSDLAPLPIDPAMIHGVTPDGAVAPGVKVLVPNGAILDGANPLAPEKPIPGAGPSDPVPP